MTLEGFKDRLAREHKLKQNAFLLLPALGVPLSSATGWQEPVSSDTKLLPLLTDGQANAMTKVMASAAIPQAQKMKYVGDWSSLAESQAV